MPSLIRETAYHQQGRVPAVSHRHTDSDSLEIIHILSGDGNALIADRTYPLAAGTLLFIDASQVHSLNLRDEAAYRRNKLIVHRSVLEQALRSMEALSLLSVFTDHGGSCFSLTSGRAERADTLFRSLAEAPQDSATALSVLVQLRALITPELQQASQTEDARIAQVLYYLHTHYAEPITIDRLAATIPMSKYYLCHLFHRHTGMTVMQYLTEQRLTSARRMLLHTRATVTEIAQNCGFGSPSQFCSLFRKREGLTPRQYRTANGEADSP